MKLYRRRPIPETAANESFKPQPPKPGTHLEAKWDGEWYPATFKAVQGNKWIVTWHDGEWDHPVKPSDVRIPGLKTQTNLQIKIRKNGAGSYILRDSEGHEVDITFHSPRDGAHFTGWIASANWDRYRYSDDVRTKEEAVKIAVQMLRSKRDF